MNSCQYFVTGLLIWIPLVITLWVLYTILSTLDQTLYYYYPHPGGRKIDYLRRENQSHRRWCCPYLADHFFTGLHDPEFHQLGARPGKNYTQADSRHRQLIYSSVKQVSDFHRPEMPSKAVLIEYPAS